MQRHRTDSSSAAWRNKEWFLPTRPDFAAAVARAGDRGSCCRHLSTYRERHLQRRVWADAVLGRQRQSVRAGCAGPRRAAYHPGVRVKLQTRRKRAMDQAHDRRGRSGQDRGVGARLPDGEPGVLRVILKDRRGAARTSLGPLVPGGLCPEIEPAMVATNVVTAATTWLRRSRTPYPDSPNMAMRTTPSSDNPTIAKTVLVVRLPLRAEVASLAIR
jgi:hypothetical protein